MMDGLNGIDYGIIGIIFISVLFGLLRGFVREAMSLMTWIVAGVLGALYCDEVGALFTSISIEGVRLLLAFILIVLATLILGGIISHLISKLIQSTKFSITDRIIGVLFGFARGVAIISIAVLMVKPSVIAKKEIWKTSVLAPLFEPVALWVKAQLPEDLLKFYENSPQNPDDLKKAIEKTTQKATGIARDSAKEEKEPIEKALEKPLNFDAEEIGSIEELPDNALSD